MSGRPEECVSSPERTAAVLAVSPSPAERVRTDLHGWILEHRQELLNAVAGLIQYWHQQACPPGETAYTSFPEWARVVGGILVTCGLGDPCVPQLDGTLTSDTTDR